MPIFSYRHLTSLPHKSDAQRLSFLVEVCWQVFVPVLRSPRDIFTRGPWDLSFADPFVWELRITGHLATGYRIPHRDTRWWRIHFITGNVFPVFSSIFGKHSPCRIIGMPPWSNGSVLDHRSLPPVFESRRGQNWRLFHLWIRFITLGNRSAHLA